jgi:hypothetical protein
MQAGGGKFIFKPPMDADGHGLKKKTLTRISRINANFKGGLSPASGSNLRLLYPCSSVFIHGRKICLG